MIKITNLIRNFENELTHLFYTSQDTDSEDSYGWGRSYHSSSEDGEKDNHSIDKEQYELRYLIKI